MTLKGARKVRIFDDYPSKSGSYFNSRRASYLGST